MRPHGLLLSVAAAAAGLASVAQAQTVLCDNKDYQVMLYRYDGTTCSGTETIAYYQSGSAIRESPTKYKIYTCCNDKKTVSVFDSTTGTTTNVVDDQCLDGSAGQTGSGGTSDETSYKFECIANPTEATVTLTVYGEGDTSCSSSSLPEFQIPVYEGCNEDFPYLMDLKCQGTDVRVQYSLNRVEQCEVLEFDDNPTYFTLSPGCNVPDPDSPFFGLFDDPIFLATSCGTGGMSGGAIAAIVIIVLLLLGAGGFAYWRFAIYGKTAKADTGFTEYNEYSQLDGETHNDLL